MTDLVPCAVVVDSRNMRGQASKMFGWPQMVSVEGVRAAMRLYGLDAVSVDVGVATRAADSSPSRKLAQSLEQNRAYRDKLIADGASVLEGHLVERKSQMEEKQVDVLCAVQVCNLADEIATGLHQARLIVVLSEDMDLMPAYAFARKRGVTAYAAAYDTVHQREQQRDWILLNEAALKSLVSPPGRLVGSELRSKLATIATSDEDPVPLRWTVHSPAPTSGGYRMRGNLGAAGLWVPGRRVNHKDKVDLYAVGLTINSEEGGRFPHVVLSETPPASTPMPDTARAEVAYWQSPTSVKVSIGGQLASVRATPGTLLPGQEVVVLRRTSSPGSATYLVGALSDAPSVPGWTVPEPVTFATVTADPVSSGSWIPAELDVTGDKVMIHAKHLDHTAQGTRLSVFLSGQLPRRGTPTVMPLTCCLP